MNKEKIEEKIKKCITIENLLCLFIMICPILDVSSFLFRNYFNTSISISTIIRPIIPIISIIYIFFKDKIKWPMFVGGLIYGLYAIIHFYIFKTLQTGISYGNIIREIQYVVNYSFMIMNLFVYLYIFIFRKKDEQKSQGIAKIKISILISFTIYILLMFMAILTGTSSHTYAVDKMGFKGWFESGNSVGAIMILMMFVVLTMINKESKKSVRIIGAIDIILSGIYLSTLLGTRVGLFGFSLVIFIYAICEILYNAYHSKKVSKKELIIGTSVFAGLAIIVICFGSITLARRQLLKNREDLIYDDNLGESAHVTGDILELVNKIKNNEIDEMYMSKNTQNAFIDLYNFNNKHNIASTNMRAIQLVYHISLVMEQKNIGALLFGNGYMTHFRELIFEMEVPAFLFNFGIFGFILYFIPFLIIAVYGLIYAIKNIKDITTKAIMPIVAVCFAIAVSLLAGYTFFNQSTVLMIIAMCVISVYEIINMKGKKSEEDNIWNNKSDLRGSGKSISGYCKQTSRKV